MDAHQNVTAINGSFFISLLTLSLLWSCPQRQSNDTMEIPQENKYFSTQDTSPVKVSNEVWKQVLSPDLYYVAREKGTEQPFTSPLEEMDEVGTYVCAVCGNLLFESNAKFNSGCGWPSFFKPVTSNSIVYTPDHSHGMNRTEITCKRCNSHLGHVFDDGPPPTGLRYCLNGVSLRFIPKPK